MIFTVLIIIIIIIIFSIIVIMYSALWFMASDWLPLRHPEEKIFRNAGINLVA